MTAETPMQSMQEGLPLARRIAFSVTIRVIQAALSSSRWLGSFTATSGYAPDAVKTYRVRSNLPVRIFFPSSYTVGSSTTLPTLFTIHGGGFCVGSPQDDDAWNRNFSDTHSILVIALNYSKAPGAPFPVGLDDLVSLYLAILDDATLPIDKVDGGRIAVCGFSAGGNLALGLSQKLLRSNQQSLQLPTCLPRAAVSVYGALDLSRSPDAKVDTRQYKTDPTLGAPRTASRDFLLSTAPLFDWSYLPVRQNLRDPLVSPGPYADPTELPPHVFIIASELDMLANESLECAKRMARCRGSSRPVLGGDLLVDSLPTRCGRSNSGKPGELEMDDENFAWEETFHDGSVKWLLVPDVLHGFDSLPLRARFGGEETMKDAELKTEAYCKVLGDWLLGSAFKNLKVQRDKLPPEDEDATFQYSGPHEL